MNTQQHDLFQEWAKCFDQFAKDHNSILTDMRETFETNQSHILAEYRPDTYYKAIFGDDFLEKIVGTVEDELANALLDTLDTLMIGYFGNKIIHLSKQ